MDIFSERLKIERNANNLSQEEMAKKLEITQGTYMHYELIGTKSGREPSFDTIRRIAKVLDVSLDYLFGLEE